MAPGSTGWLYGRRIVCASNRDGNFNLYQKDSSGAGKEDSLLNTDETKFRYDWSPDGRFVLYSSPVTPGRKSDLWFLPLTGDNRKPVLYLQTAASESKARFCPDGRFVAYTSDASGMNEYPTFKTGIPKALFPAPIWGPPMFVTRYDVTADGKKFLINTLRPEATGAASTPITVMLNWQAGLKK